MSRAAASIAHASDRLSSGGNLIGALDLSRIEDVASVLRVDEFHRHIARIRRAIEKDPEQAVGSSKELLESVLKAILGEHGQKGRSEIPELLKRVQKQLSLESDSVLNGAPGADTIRRSLSNLGQLVVGVVEVRNLYGTGHGRVGSRELDAAHTRLVVNAATTLATYFIDVWRLSVETGVALRI
jgi:Abortive infection C-terminus